MIASGTKRTRGLRGLIDTGDIERIVSEAKKRYITVIIYEAFGEIRKPSF